MCKLAFFITTWAVSSLKLSADFQGQPFGVSYCRNVQRHLQKAAFVNGIFFVVLILAWASSTLSSSRLHKVHLHNNSIGSGPLPERPGVRSITNDPLNNLILQCQGNSMQVCHFNTTFSAQHPLCSHTTTLSCSFCLTWLIAYSWFLSQTSHNGKEDAVHGTPLQQDILQRASSVCHLKGTRDMYVKKCQANTVFLVLTRHLSLWVESFKQISQLDSLNNLCKIWNMTCSANTCSSDYKKSN